MTTLWLDTSNVDHRQPGTFSWNMISDNVLTIDRAYSYSIHITHAQTQNTCESEFAGIIGCRLQ